MNVNKMIKLYECTPICTGSSLQLCFQNISYQDIINVTQENNTNYLHSFALPH
uniref:Uncharacterized protein n=1 Tax=Anguilla anguilla TaxID=7936 RepID=A0A0E9PWS2_ANGAN